ncbi:MAG: hypothetical protein NVSMB46_08700 [Candidatus Saccharimonadales bacterium]
MADIFLLEPDVILGDIYSKAFQSHGHSVRLHNDAQLSINYIDESKPDLIILEAQLVEHNGVEFLYELRSYAEWQDIPIIMHTIIPENKFALKDIKHLVGIRDYLYKPQTTLAKLFLTVDRVLSHAMTI